MIRKMTPIDVEKAIDRSGLTASKIEATAGFAVGVLSKARNGAKDLTDEQAHKLRWIAANPKKDFALYHGMPAADEPDSTVQVEEQAPPEPPVEAPLLVIDEPAKEEVLIVQEGAEYNNDSGVLTVPLKTDQEKIELLRDSASQGSAIVATTETGSHVFDVEKLNARIKELEWVKDVEDFCKEFNCTPDDIMHSHAAFVKKCKEEDIEAIEMLEVKTPVKDPVKHPTPSSELTGLMEKHSDYVAAGDLPTHYDLVKSSSVNRPNRKPLF